MQVNTTTPPFSGTYYLYACINTLEDEDNTENNCALATLVVQLEEVTEEPEEEPDLTVAFALSPPRTVAPGALITFYTRVRNIGDADAANSRIRLFRHTQQTSTPRIGGTEVATTSLSPAPRAGRGVIRSLQGRAPSTPGTYYFSLCVDQTEGERDTTNNCTSQSRPIIVQRATEETPEEPEAPTQTTAFSVTNVTSTPTSLQSASLLTISATITNTGTINAQSPITIYRHTNTTATPRIEGVREPNTATTGSLAPNASVTVTSTHTAPTVNRTTTYYYYVCAGTFCSADPRHRYRPGKTGRSGTAVYRLLDSVPSRNTPMGGDRLLYSSTQRVVGHQ